MTNAKRKFDQTIVRCEKLVHDFSEIKQAYENGQVTFEPSQDLLRAAIVLSVAAFDAYATDCFAEKFVDHVKRFGTNDEIETMLTKAGFDIKFSLELLSAKRPYRRIRTLIDHYYSNYVTEKLDVIDKLYEMYCIRQFTHNAANRSGKDPQRLLSSVQKLVNRRHSIAHDSDYNEHGKLKRVNAMDTNRINDLKLLVDNMDAIIENKFSRSRRH